MIRRPLRRFIVTAAVAALTAACIVGGARRHRRRPAIGVRGMPCRRGGLRPRPPGVAGRRTARQHLHQRAAPEDGQEHQPLRGALPRRQRDRRRRQRHEPAHPEHHRKLPRHPDRARRVLPGRGRHRRGAGCPVQRSSASINPCPPARISTSPRSHCSATAANGWGPSRTSTRSTRERTIELCHGADPICNPADPDTWENNLPDHLAKAYISAGMANQAADFVAGRV